MRVTCPTCGVTTTWEENAHRPFCSERCRMVDLGRWAAEEHRIPGEPAPEAANEALERGGDRTEGEAERDGRQADRRSGA